MIARNGSRQVRDYGPSPAGVDGLRSVNAMALASEVFVSPVERRYLTPQELAAIREQDEPPLRVMALQTRTREFVLPSRSVQAAHAADARWERLARHDLPTIWKTLRDCGGVVYAAAMALGQDPSTLRARVKRNLDKAPADVQALVASPRYDGKWAKREVAA